MDVQKIARILEETAFTRTGGSPEELKCAQYIVEQCAQMGLKAELEAFEVEMATVETAELLADGVSVPCKAYYCCGDAELEAPFYYLAGSDPYALSKCKGCIVMINNAMNHWTYQDVLENGALGFITFSGDANYVDDDIDQKELRASVHQGNKIPGVNINAKSAIDLIRRGVTTAKITIKQEESMGTSHNVVLDMPGEIEETIVLTAHYDSTALSLGSYDNMSGSIGLLGIAEYFASHPHRYGLRFIWCGSEERGLLGSKAYVAAHEEELKNFPLNINLDMIGCIMGNFLACCSCEDKLASYISYMSHELDFGIFAYQDVYSSDSSPFADKGVPAVSFARVAPTNTATIHNRYDTLAVMKPEQLAKDVDFLVAFTGRMANAIHCPVDRKIPDSVKDKLDIYFNRKRGPKKF